MQETRDVGSIPGLGRSLEKGMAGLSSTLVWRILWTEEPCGLQSTGSQRVGQTEAIEQTCTQAHIFSPPLIKLSFDFFQNEILEKKG